MQQIIGDGDLMAVLADVTMQNSVLDFNWRFKVRVCEQGWLVRVAFERPDTNSGEVGEGLSREEFVAVGTTVSGVVKTAWLLIELTVRHELMEGFRYRGCRIFNPHHSVEQLATLEQNRS